MNEEAVKALFGIDFDGTIAAGHTHNTIYHVGELDPEQQWNLVKEIKPIGSALEWNKLFHLLHTDGHYIAILSFNAYPHIIHRYLIEIIKLDSNFVDTHIRIISFTPEDQSNKSEHLRLANESLHLAERLLILIDDAYCNYLHAMTSGHLLSILATSSGDHLKKMRELSKSVKKPYVAEKENGLSSSSDSINGLAAPLGASMENIYNSGDSPPCDSPRELRDSPDESQRNTLRSSLANFKFN